MTTRFYTICRNERAATDSNRWRRHIVDTILSESDTKSRLALVFDVHTAHFDIFEEISRDVLMSGVFSYPLYGSVYDNRLIISDFPKMVEPLWETTDDKFLITDIKRNCHKISCKAVFRECIRPAKFGSGCNTCPLYPTPEKCVVKLLHTWCKKENKRGLLPAKNSPSDNLTDDEIFRRFRGKNCAGFEFVTPFEVRDNSVRIPRGKLSLLRNPSHCWFDHVETNRNQVKERAEHSANSRKYHRICNTECDLHKICDWRYYKPSRASKCLSNSYESRGPFKESWLAETFIRWFHQKFDGADRLNNKQISFIAANAGMMTGGFGKPLKLVGTDSDLRHVHFFDDRWRYQSHCFLNFDDAVELLRLPWRDKKSGKIRVPEALYYPEMEMSETELALYAATIQFECLPGSSRRFGYTYPIINSVLWNTQPNFLLSIGTTHWPGGEIRTFTDFVGRFNVWQTIGKLRVSAGGVSWVPNLGIRP